MARGDAWASRACLATFQGKWKGLPSVILYIVSLRLKSNFSSENIDYGTGQERLTDRGPWELGILRES